MKLNKTILFSPVGGTDPISNTNCQDGALLHISRVYKPDEVYMYMSAEILEFHKKDNRYLYCLDELCKLQKREEKRHIIERGELKDVQVFDYFLRDFREIIAEIGEKLDDTDTLLLNISSGTPAMKSAILALATLGDYPYRLVQVSTPQKSMNEHNHKNYDVKTLWELNEDNNENFENRCEEIKVPTLAQIKQEEIIKKLVKVYDYKAALEIAKTLDKSDTEKYLPLLEIAKVRLDLDLSKLNSLVKTHNVDFIPIKSEDKQKYFEYALNMDIKRKKGELTDFIRAISPLIMDLFLLILKNACKLNIKDFSYEQNNILKWDEGKLKQNNKELDKILNKNFIPFNYREIYSSHLTVIISEYSSDAKLKNIVKKIREVEKNVRNLAAHQIVSLSDDIIKRKVGINSEEIMQLLKDAFKYTGLNITQKHWDSYDKMNEAIIAAMP
ncbi:MAG: hypothetical protein J6M62_03535 [Selenomonadaceae bacterium]|nr:hypothetical protein [Selenomonadaceae bacterium]